MIRLSEAVDFDAADGESVDLLFGLLVPTDLDDTHIADISMITSVLSDDGLRARLRESTSSNDLYDSLMNGCGLAAPENLQVQQGP